MLKNRLTKSFFIALALHLSVFLVAAIVIKNCHKTSPEPNYVEVSLLDDINYGNSGENGGSSENNKKILVSRQQYRAYQNNNSSEQYYDSKVQNNVDNIGSGVVNTGPIGGVVGSGSGNGGGSGESDSVGNGNGSGDGGGSEVIKIRPNIISSSKPRYPQSARRRGIEGTVLTRILILTDGTVGAAEVVTSSGNSDLDEAALKAVWQWQFSPASNSLGQNVECYTTIPIGFSLS